MRVLILGGSGMLGHKLFQELSERFETYATFREPRGAWRTFPSYGKAVERRLLSGVDALQFDSVVRAFGQARPEVVINCIGIVKQLPEANDPVPCLTINALLPHRLADLCRTAGTRLIHISTDCVFNGRKGGYTEDDPPDAEDLYGRSKLLGELDRPDSLTLRTSIIGRDFQHDHGLLEWFLAQRGGVVKGYRGVIYSGLTTRALARLIAALIEWHPRLAGLYQAASSPISKHDLLATIRDTLDLAVTIEPVAEPRSDRSMKAERLAAATGYRAPSWREMIADLAADPTPYDVWRKDHAATR
jgi:dTDP-4-dehydrorhamnose reductase